ncbi:type IV secretory pathway TrbL component [Labrys monachus]|uniref:Type IV secretory pathway TrbL component n=1 Tax=Labrys monachus TaxID=217067 RepID=A0ABU0FAW8_9HYPH|nr:type IV secretory pathway TrbL component [Labrys monachus]
MTLETSLYLPVKRFLEDLGFAVKGEVVGCDVLALGGGDPPIVVIGELKQSFNLELILQGVDRAGACDEIWLAARASPRAAKGGKAMRATAISAGGSASACSASPTATRCRSWSARLRRCRGGTRGDAPGSSRSIAGAGAIPPPAAARGCR